MAFYFRLTMQSPQNKTEKTYLAILTLVAWFALVFQFYLQFNSGVAPKPELLVRFFSYFTIDSNLLVAICSTSIMCFPKTGLGNFFSKPSVKTALTVYITVVALVYNTVLRFLWVLEGWAMVLNELLHVVVPLMFLVYWIFFVPKYELKWKNIWGWLIYPLVYTVFVMVRGSFVEFYPYPFLNVNKLGVAKVLFNCIAITLLFALLSAIFIAIGKRSARQLKA